MYACDRVFNKLTVYNDVSGLVCCLSESGFFLGSVIGVLDTTVGLEEVKFS